MSKYQEALERVNYSLELIDCMTSEQRRSLGAMSYAIEANLDYIKEVLPKITTKEILKKPYANDKGGYSCRGCDCDVFLRDEICYFCDMELDWSDEI